MRGAGTLVRDLASCSAHRGFYARSDYERQRAFIMNRKLRMLHAERAKHLACLRHNRIAVIGRYAGLQRDLQST